MGTFLLELLRYQNSQIYYAGRSVQKFETQWGGVRCKKGGRRGRPAWVTHVDTFFKEYNSLLPCDDKRLKHPLCPVYIKPASITGKGKV